MFDLAECSMYDNKIVLSPYLKYVAPVDLQLSLIPRNNQIIGTDVTKTVRKNRQIKITYADNVLQDDKKGYIITK